VHYNCAAQKFMLETTWRTSFPAYEL